MSDKKITVTPARMGRPAIGKFTAVRLPPEMLERIDARTGPGKRAAFIRAAIEYVLSDMEQLEMDRDSDGEVHLVRKSDNRYVKPNKPAVGR